MLFIVSGLSHLTTFTSQLLVIPALNAGDVLCVLRNCSWFPGSQWQKLPLCLVGLTGIRPTESCIYIGQRGILLICQQLSFYNMQLFILVSNVQNGDMLTGELLQILLTLVVEHLMSVQGNSTSANSAK